MRKGVFFTIDALIGISVVLFSLIVLSSFSVTQQDSPVIEYYSTDLVKAFSNVKVGEINNDYVTQLIGSGDITKLNNTIFEQLGEFWATGQDALAERFINNITDSLIPQRFGYSILVNDEVIYTDGKSIDTSLVSAKKIISGIERDKPLEGFTARSFLSQIEDKREFSYVYLGGFVGQGNITVFIDDIPAAATLQELYLEVDGGDDFNLFINGNQCGLVYNVSDDTFIADAWNITSCLGSVTAGAQNNFTIIFPAGLSEAFVGGGFIRVQYLTTEFQPESTAGEVTKQLPGISGIINLFDSFYVPGTLHHLNIVLHVETNAENNTLYMSIGNQTIFRASNLTTEETFILTDTNLTPLLDYSELGLKTVPIRIGFENVSFSSIFQGNGDVALITDVSGSMNDEMGSTSNGVLRSCDDPQLSDSDTQRLSVAKCLDADFAEDILNVTGNQLGLISFESSTQTGNTHLLSTDLVSLNTTINSYSANGGTCICCGINSARDILVVASGAQTLIDEKETWKYNTNYFFGIPPADGEGDQWYEQSYDDSSWPSGSGILGSTNNFIYSPTVDTEIGSDLEVNGTYVDLWEHGDDDNGPPNDFTSGTLNQTANTFGRGNGNDGWDSASGVFDYGGSVTFNGIVNERLRMFAENSDDSGAYGVEVNITQEMFDILSNNGIAVLSFDWWWDDRGNFESSDQIWVKAYWDSPTSGITYLGANLDGGHNPSDATNEIYTDEDPDGDNSGTHIQSIGQWIEGPGMYYLALGGKLDANNNNEDGRWEFDNIYINIYHVSQGGVFFADLWEHGDDDNGPPNDFSGGTLNLTSDTYGLGNGNDGWDRGSGVFDYASSLTHNDIVSGRLDLSAPSSNNNDVSGAYGVEVNITQEMFDLINGSNISMAIISFDWWWDESGSYETNDEIWIKGFWESPTSGVHWLGEDLDEGHDPEDATEEIYADEDPDIDNSGFFGQEIKQWIEGPGMYYLALGGKLKRSSTDERGDWSFDNIRLKISNTSNHYYFRKEFTIADINLVERGILSILSDDFATVYLNGEIISQESAEHLAKHWNVIGQIIDKEYLQNGTNVIAVDLTNSDQSAKFDLKLRSINDSRDKAMLVMTDGEATRSCAEQGTTGDVDGDGQANTDSDDAVQAACDARQDYGIQVFSVGFSDFAEEITLQAIAECGGGIFEKSDSLDELQNFYQDVASFIISTARRSQTIEVEGEGGITESVLFSDSYMWMNFTPGTTPPQFDEIALSFEERNFANCSFNVSIPPEFRVGDALLTSYSSEHWTDLLIVNDNVVYNLSTYSPQYTLLGDPFTVEINPSVLVPGNNTFTVTTGDIPGNSSGCSLNNSFIYTGLISSSVSYSEVVQTDEGCAWTIETEEEGNISLSVPIDYSGGNMCSYTSTSIVYNNQDSNDAAVYDLLVNLDFDSNGKININIDEADLQIESLSISQVPSLWGPSIAEIRVWE